MEKEDLLKKLESLAQLDYDAVRVYEDALKHVDDEDVQTRFKIFQEQHKHHAGWLSDEIVRYGRERPQLKVDMAGHLADWMTELRSIGGTEGALHAMRTAERYHNRRYGDALDWDTGDETLQKTLRRFDDEERRHLEYIEEKLGVHTAATKE